ncbi:MAG: hypothetical protein JKY50_02795 [Oleispira sp.]|nr:hypothetical protein [Oleispira sp.]
MSSSLVGSRVIVSSNDFVDQDLKASIVMIGPDSRGILLELDEILKCKSMIYRYVVASPRASQHEFFSGNLNSISGCSVTWIPHEKYNRNDPMDLSWWRGGAAAITDLRLIGL